MIKLANIFEGSLTGVDRTRLLNVDGSGILIDNGSGQDWAIDPVAAAAWVAAVIPAGTTDYVWFDWEIDLAVIAGFYNSNAGLLAAASQLIDIARAHAPNAKYSYYAVPFNDWFEVCDDIVNGTSDYLANISTPGLFSLYNNMDWLGVDAYDTFANGFTSSIGGDPAKDCAVHSRFSTDWLTAMSNAGIPNLPIIVGIWQRYRDITPAVNDGYGFRCIPDAELQDHLECLWLPTVNGVGIAGFNNFTSEQFFYQSTQANPANFRHQIYAAEVGIDPAVTPWSPIVQAFSANKQENLFNIVCQVMDSAPRGGQLFDIDGPLKWSVS